jgi:leucyl aminopeptidase
MKIVYNNEIHKDEVIIQVVNANEMLVDDLDGVNQELRYLFESGVFEGKKDQFHFLRKGKNYMLIGVGEKDALDLAAMKKTIASVIQEVKKMGLSKLAYRCNNTEILPVVVETIILANYSFDTYKTSDEKEGIKTLNILRKSIHDIDSIDEHQVLAEAVITARDLSNEPANVLTPTELARRASVLGETFGFEVEILGQEEIEKQEMKAFLSVAKASDQEPKFIIMRYKGNPESKEIYGVVGKGLTYDSGGLSIKPTNGMVTMKEDMSGASAAIGLMVAAARNALTVNITAVVAACENLISGKGYKPGDIIGSRSGKNIFVANTDAEGRLTLVDAVDYIIDQEKVKSVIDIATLTGSAVECLGTTTTAVCTNNDDMMERLKRASEKADERVWQMPIFDDYREQLKHHDADLSNLGGKPGMITAAAFIEAFVKDTPWLHLDIAGTSWADKASGYFSKGATGVGVRLLYHYMKDLV